MRQAKDCGEDANHRGRPTGGDPPGEKLGLARSHREAVRETWLVAGLIATMVGFSVAPIVNDQAGRLNKDYGLWFYAGRAVAQGLPIYPLDGRMFPFMYPPSAAAMLAILSQLGSTAFLLALLALNSLAWVASIGLSLYLVSGRVGRHHPLLYLVPSLGVIAYVHDTYLLGQPNLGLLACMLGALTCLATRRRWQVAAGSLVALAAAIKAFPFLAIGYLIYRRFWKATAAMIVALTLMIVVLPMPFRGVAAAYQDAGTWTMGMVFRYDSGSIAQRPERGFGFKNQSLMALANRLLRDIPADGEARDGWKVNFASLSFGAVNKIILASAACLGLLYVGLMPWSAPRGGPVLAVEGALLLLLILAFSPLSFNYFYVWLLYPLTVALFLALEAPPGSATRRWLGGSVVAALGLLSASLFSARVAAGYGNSLLAGASLFAGLGGWLAVNPDLDSPLRMLMRRLRKADRISPRHPTPTALKLAGPHDPMAGNLAAGDRPGQVVDRDRS